MDLDGAKSKHIVNDNVLKAITSATSLTVDFGGGIKTEEDIEKAFDAGAAMVTVGSIAVTNPELFLSWIDKYGAGRLILGADVRNGKISINGWKEDSAEDLLPFLKQYTDKGVRNVLCTEISKDGTLQGPAIELYKEIMAASPSDCLGRCKLQRGYRCFGDGRHSCGGVRQSFLRGKNRHRQIGSLSPP